ncbi:alpha-L-glutamate ligase [Kitasatospora terrestris]|uniref:ATP-grasp fold RimK-type domain-containing protein n=1 Tax=Kitasatospora terrestris TaxID=258051 RepID=A0ABP9EJG1_9ACTN
MTVAVGLLTPAPDHPLLAGAAQVLRAGGHRVVPAGEGCDVVLLKARTPAALEQARRLEESGTPVLNSAASTGFCQDRVAMARCARDAGLPFAETSHAGPVDRLAYRRPVVVKSRRSSKQDLVALVSSARQLAELAERWPGEDVVVQEPAPADGWDHKLWVVGGRLFAELRHSELADGPVRASRSLDLDRLPDGYRELAFSCGEAFGLDVYGVDVLDAGGRPVVVDVNAFPGVRGQAGAPEALAALALATAAGRHRPRRLPGAAG